MLHFGKRPDVLGPMDSGIAVPTGMAEMVQSMGRHDARPIGRNGILSRGTLKIYTVEPYSPDGTFVAEDGLVSAEYSTVLSLGRLADGTVAVTPPAEGDHATVSDLVDVIEARWPSPEDPQ